MLHTVSRSLVLPFALLTQGPGAVNSTSADTATSHFVITGLPPAVELAEWWWRILTNRVRPQCIPFEARSLDHAPVSAVITTEGLGQAMLVRNGPSLSGPCSQLARAGKRLLELDSVSRAGTSLSLILPPEVFPHGSTPVEGRVVAFANGRVMNASVKLQREPWSTFAQAVFWICGILLPALLTVALGYEANKWRKRWEIDDDQERKLLEFRQRLRSDLDVFFEGVFTNRFDADGKEFAEGITADLSHKGIMDVLPPRRLQRLNRAITNGSRKALVAEIALAFPDQAETINKVIVPPKKTRKNRPKAQGAA